jgi:hypothetical protein
MKRLIPYLAAAIAGAAVLALAGLVLGPADPGKAATPAPPATWTAPDKAFSIHTPAGWKAVAHGPAATVLSRDDKRGSVVIRPRARVQGSYDGLARGLTRRLERQFADFRLVSSRVATVGAGQGLVYTFARPAANQVQSVIVAPAGDRAYTLDVVSAADDPHVAGEIAAMVRSFRPVQAAPGAAE